MTHHIFPLNAKMVLTLEVRSTMKICPSDREPFKMPYLPMEGWIKNERGFIGKIRMQLYTV